MCIDDSALSYDCGVPENCQAPFIQSRYLADLVDVLPKTITLGVSYDTNIPPKILQAANSISIVPFITYSEDAKKKAHSVFRRLHLCMFYKSFDDFERVLSEGKTIFINMDRYKL